jgi:GNAT superfamily N-acetyltransferase
MLKAQKSRIQMTTKPPNKIEIRPARIEDVPLLREFIFALAEYEKLSADCFATEEKLARTLFGEKPAAEALLAFYNGAPAGFAIFFQTYSTFLAQPGVYMEDLFVKPEFRRQGIGEALFRRIGAIARERGYGRFEWAALNWNAPAIAFYERMGARGLDEWTTFRLAGDALQKLGRD